MVGLVVVDVLLARVFAPVFGDGAMLVVEILVVWCLFSTQCSQCPS